MNCAYFLVILDDPLSILELAERCRICDARKGMASISAPCNGGGLHELMSSYGKPGNLKKSAIEVNPWCDARGSIAMFA
jgi:hypothetical protein